jgi:hypothetical protein
VPVTTANLEQVFTYHAPTPPLPDAYEAIRGAARLFAVTNLECTPVCADQQAALRHVREAMMTANAAIALGGAV